MAASGSVRVALPVGVFLSVLGPCQRPGPCRGPRPGALSPSSCPRLPGCEQQPSCLPAQKCEMVSPPFQGKILPLTAALPSAASLGPRAALPRPVSLGGPRILTKPGTPFFLLFPSLCFHRWRFARHPPAAAPLSSWTPPAADLPGRVLIAAPAPVPFGPTPRCFIPPLRCFSCDCFCVSAPYATY